MRDDEAQAIAWVGKQSQRVITYAGAPFIVLGFASAAPAFFAGQWLFGSVKLSALVACGPVIGLAFAGMKLSEHVRRWMLPSLIARAAKQFDVDQKPLAELLLPEKPR